MADGVNLKTPSNKKHQVTVNQSFATQMLGAEIKSKNPQLSVGTQTRPTQRRLEQSIASSKKTERTGNVEIKSASGGIKTAFFEIRDELDRQNGAFKRCPEAETASWGIFCIRWGQESCVHSGRNA
jgi:flagellar basal body rod protein FlgG